MKKSAALSKVQIHRRAGEVDGHADAGGWGRPKRARRARCLDRELQCPPARAAGRDHWPRRRPHGPRRWVAFGRRSTRSQPEVAAPQGATPSAQAQPARLTPLQAPGRRARSHQRPGASPHHSHRPSACPRTVHANAMALTSPRPTAHDASTPTTCARSRIERGWRHCHSRCSQLNRRASSARRTARGGGTQPASITSAL